MFDIGISEVVKGRIQNFKKEWEGEGVVILESVKLTPMKRVGWGKNY